MPARLRLADLLAGLSVAIPTRPSGHGARAWSSSELSTICTVTRMARATLRYVDPGRGRGLAYRLYVALVGTRLMGWVSRRVVWKLDPLLLSLTGGRLGMGLGLPTALLETKGARSGQRRRSGVIYFHDDDKVVVVASKLGLPAHPAWFHNLRANPEVLLGGQPFIAQVVEDETERQRLWKLADRVFPPYAAYRERAGGVGRTIPIVELTPRSH